MIPKIIHYCWFGGNPKPEIIEKCIASWKEHCPDWEIREWNESNYDVNAHPYTKEAYEAKKWAFVSDLARLEIVYNCGGVYMDTDVELRSGLVHLLENDAFYVFESDININSGQGFGCIAGHYSLKAMIDIYRDIHFLNNRKYDLSPCPAKNTEGLKYIYPEFLRNGKPQVFDGVRILSTGEYAAFATHHMAGTWGQGPLENRVYRDTKLKRFLRKPERIQYVEDHFGKRMWKIYVFCVYDVMELGIWYYVKRAWSKLFNRNKHKSN